jgi:hypothetical protein
MGRRRQSRRIATRSISRRTVRCTSQSSLIAILPLALCAALVSQAGAATGPPSAIPFGAPRASAAPAFCSRLTISTIESIVGGSVTLLETSDKGKIIACIFKGSAGTISIETETGLSTASTSTLTGAEKAATANFPAGLKIMYGSVPSIGPTAYSWSAKIYGTPYVGLNTNKGSTGYYIEMQGALKLPVLEKLIRFEMASK